MVSCAHNISVTKNKLKHHAVIFLILLKAARLHCLHRATDITAMTVQATISSTTNTASDGVTAFTMASYFVHKHIQDETIDGINGDGSDDGDGDGTGNDGKIGNNEDNEVKEEGHSVISFSLFEMTNNKIGLILILLLLIYPNACTLHTCIPSFERQPNTLACQQYL